MAAHMFDNVQFEDENLMIVDGTNLSFRFKHRGSKNFKEDFLKTVQSLARSYAAKHVLVLFDSHGSDYRKDIYPDYKGDRKEKYANQTPAEQQAAKEFFIALDECIAYIKQYYPTLQVRGVEADDLAAYAQKLLSDNYERIWLISTDKDWDQLLDQFTHRFSYVTRVEYTLDNFYDTKKVDSPQQWAMLKAIQGGKDNVNGVQDIAETRGYGIIRNYDTLLDLIDDLPLEGKAKYIQRLNSSAELLMLNYQLTDLKEFCVQAIGHNNPGRLEEVTDFLLNIDKFRPSLTEVVYTPTEQDFEDMEDLK